MANKLTPETSNSLDAPPSDSAAISAGTTPAHRRLSIVFVIAAFLSSTLLFLVQPLVARLLLPLAGGSAALWNTAMVFFQVTLLFGYAFAHGTIRKAGTRRHAFVQAPVLLLPLVFLPLAIPSGWTLPNNIEPSLWVLGVLAFMVGIPFFALATTSPTLQMWFSATDHPRAADPYFLYAAGNLGSVLALLGYPLVLEPLFSLRTQTELWAIGYLLYVIACAAAAYIARQHHVDRPQHTSEATLEPLTAKRQLRWLFWGFVPSALMLGVTLYASTDLASFPLLWIVPLLLYLLTFIIAFGKDSLTRSSRAATFVLVTAVPIALSNLIPTRFNLLVLVGHLIWFFAAALLCHSRLADDRPPTGQLTTFYLILSLGGALGGIFSSLIAPRIFATVVEYPIAITLVLFAALPPVRNALPRPVATALLAGSAAAAVAFVVAPPYMAIAWLAGVVIAGIGYGPRGAVIMLVGALALGPILVNARGLVALDRSFFGVYKVEDIAVNGLPTRTITSGTTIHGFELLERSERAEPTAYYFHAGPVGTVIDATKPRRVGVIGLGAGTIAAYANPGDEYVFWDIDQLVVDIAADPTLFTYLRDTRGDVDIIVDDGRHGVAVSDGDFDLIVIDAFGSDAIPVHLMTAEATGQYLDKLAPGGSVIVHISNRHFDLKPVVGSAAAAAGTEAFVYDYTPTSADRARGGSPSTWAAMGRPNESPEWRELDAFVPLPSDGVPWTDDYSNVLSALKFD